MPGDTPKRDVASGDSTCRRCGDSEAKVTIRNEPLCKDCFVKYVNSKIVKRMESFRVRNASSKSARKLLLPLSFGVSSMTLLDALNNQTGRQIKRTGQTGFELVVLHLNDQAQHMQHLDSALKKLRELYPRHEFVSIEPKNDLTTFPSILKSPLNSNPEAGEQFSTDSTSAFSASSQVDIDEILRMLNIIEYAKNAGCEAILWSDTTTRLAEKILSATAKGRGFSLPWLVNDGPSPYGIDFMFPLRDLYKKEIVSYVDVTQFVSADIIQGENHNATPVSSKNMTIDGLMTDYFQSVEEQYPSIVANVVRTSSKLKARDTTDTRCGLCGLPLPKLCLENADKDLPATPAHPDGQTLCLGCVRSLNG